MIPATLRRSNIDVHVRSIIFDSLGVSQGGELTQRHALHLFAAMYPEMAAAIAVRLQDYDFDDTESIAQRIGNFAADSLHGMTGPFCDRPANYKAV